jgi:hypothetical protein
MFMYRLDRFRQFETDTGFSSVVEQGTVVVHAWLSPCRWFDSANPDILLPHRSIATDP